MTPSIKIQELKSLIKTVLTPLIDNDYWLLEVPYYTNIGDSLIWQGEMDFLRQLGYRCKGMYSSGTFHFPPINPNEIILFQGGGNFGDLWSVPHDFKMKVMAEYPNNRFVFFPQTVYFQHKENLLSCAEFMSNYDAIICARDNSSFAILKKYFKNEIVLVPDMAFFMDMSSWEIPQNSGEDLFLLRGDVELKQYEEFKNIASQHNILVSDWRFPREFNWQLKGHTQMRRHFPFLYDWYARTVFRPFMVKSGIQFIASHNKIYSTRLHAAILTILLGKASDLTWFDNSYGKNSSLYETWLCDVEDICFIK
ncbi:MAG: polysaccharide pyruvyl transferase family protein [Paludibacteraceae bacterium]|nr:polysaccharide pyruvyl transferase family protein [Paludibacteraceae bacterium]